MQTKIAGKSITELVQPLGIKLEQRELRSDACLVFVGILEINTVSIIYIIQLPVYAHIKNIGSIEFF